MLRLPANFGINPHDVARARAELIAQVRSAFDELVDDSLERTMSLPGYGDIDPAAVRSNGARQLGILVECLEQEEPNLYTDQFAELVYERAKRGLPPRSFHQLADIMEDVLTELVGRTMTMLPAKVQLAALALIRDLIDQTRVVIIDGFQRAHAESRAEVDLLASQFAAPLLPVLPGVLLMPLVGTISPARAEQIIEAMLDGVEGHGARTVILDITGLVDLDETLPVYMRRASATATMLGARLILVGVSPRIAASMASAGIELGGVRIYPTLAAALTEVSKQRFAKS
ncbi:MAG: STAS domain-containing protein [Myxococcales bacterium]|nr:STAS domain-containing protein [Myxococcales bacterium]